MASRFDPSAFIQAEDSQALAAAASVSTHLVASPQTAEICGSSTSPAATLAPIAAIAGGHAQNTPWHAHVAAIVSQPRPMFVTQDYWDELTGEAETIEHRWGEIALDAGWTSLDLFGCPPEHNPHVYGQSGLVHGIVGLLTPVKIVSLDSRAAVLQPFKGDPMRYRPGSLRAGAVHLWEAYRPTTGP